MDPLPWGSGTLFASVTPNGCEGNEKAVAVAVAVTFHQTAALTTLLILSARPPSVPFLFS